MHYTSNMLKTRSFFVCTLAIFSFFYMFNNAFAYTCPNYMFSTDLAKGATSQDVRVIQEILNLDKRTVVATTGVGSPGHETSYFGVGTREALKRFQALFIEYIGIANGKFGPKTRTTMNAVCKGPFFTGKSKNVYDTESSTKDTIPPVVAVAGPESNPFDQPFRVFVGSNEALKTPDLSGLIIENATAGDIRKVSSTTFSFLVTPNADISGPISLQFEADTLSDLAGNKNEKATNEWVVKIIGAPTTATDTLILPDIPTFDIPVPTATNDCSSVASVDASDYTNPCYGKVPTRFSNQVDPNASQDQQQQQKDNQMMQMLSGLLQGLLGKALGGAKDFGGKETGAGACVCAPAPTKHISALKGPSGAYISTGISGGGDFTGKYGPPPPICGQMIFQTMKQCTSACPGPCVPGGAGVCCNPNTDSTMFPVVGTMLPGWALGGK